MTGIAARQGSLSRSDRDADGSLATWDSVADSVCFSAPLAVELMTCQLQASARILDLGCGYGRVAAQLADAGFENVVGYDSAPGMIERGRAAFPDLTLKIGVANAIPEPDDSCDTVVASGLLTSVPDATSRAEIIAEMERVLVPGGAVFGVDFLINDQIKYDEEGRFFSSAGIEMKHFTEQELSGSFAQFIGWESRQVPACSLSGNSAMALQYTVRLPANDRLNYSGSADHRAE